MTCSTTLVYDYNRTIRVVYDYQPYEEATNSGDEYFIEKVIYKGRDITGLVDLDKIRDKIMNEIL